LSENGVHHGKNWLFNAEHCDQPVDLGLPSFWTNPASLDPLHVTLHHPMSKEFATANLHAAIHQLM
jgi:hypothetical protein